MELELGEAETVLAQKLASGEPSVRKRALRTLDDWVKGSSQAYRFDEHSMGCLCKGLYFGMWMQDKMILQEELADFMGNLLNHFNSEDQSILYVKCFFVIISKEWPRLDRWRMDKFLMLVRRLTRSVFTRLRLHNWTSSICQMYIDIFKQTVISDDVSFSEGLKSHFASVYLDELDNAGGLSVKQVNQFLLPYAELLSKKTVTNYLFNSVLDEIFISILHSFAEDAVMIQSEIVFGNNDKNETTSEEKGLKFDYNNIATMLFNVGKQAGVNTVRRKRLYNIVKKFNAATNGEHISGITFEVKPKVRKLLSKAQFASAVSRLISDQDKATAAKLKLKERRKVFRRLLSEDGKERLNVVVPKVDGDLRNGKALHK